MSTNDVGGVLELEEARSISCPAQLSLVCSTLGASGVLFMLTLDGVCKPVEAFRLSKDITIATD